VSTNPEHEKGGQYADAKQKTPRYRLWQNGIQTGINKRRYARTNWPRAPRYKPLSVGVVLLDLVPAAMHQPDLFAAENHRRQKLSPLIATRQVRS
jgi:hypothetical protein